MFRKRRLYPTSAWWMRYSNKTWCSQQRAIRFSGVLSVASPLMWWYSINLSVPQAAHVEETARSSLARGRTLPAVFRRLIVASRFDRRGTPWRSSIANTSDFPIRKRCAISFPLYPRLYISPARTSTSSPLIRPPRANCIASFFGRICTPILPSRRYTVAELHPSSRAIAGAGWRRSTYSRRSHSSLPFTGSMSSILPEKGERS